MTYKSQTTNRTKESQHKWRYKMTLSDIKHRLTQKNIQLTQVVAFDRHYCIGKDNQLAWHIPEDLKHFKKITTNGVIIMGRKTYESIGQALPNRVNWVVTQDKNWTADGIKIAHSIEQVLELASQDVLGGQNSELFIIGGGEIFKQTLQICDKLQITRIDLDVQGDTFYPNIPPKFVLTNSESGMSKKNGIKFVFETYVKTA